MFYSIALHVQVAVVTKAKLDEVAVKGICDCPSGGDENDQPSGKQVRFIFI